MNKLRLPVEEKCGYCSESSAFIHVPQTNRCSARFEVRYSRAGEEGNIVFKL